MKRHVGKLTLALFLVTIVSFGALCGAVDVWAQEGSFAKQILGSWMCVSVINEQDGKRIDAFGPNPKGLLILTPDGRVSLFQMRASLPKFASNNRSKGTPEEYQAIMQGFIALYGSYTVVSEKENTIRLHIEGSNFPNWDGQDQMRTLTIVGDE